jgi:Cu+-exporting ATPase
MHCAACAARIEKALKATPGVDAATVNFATATASVEVAGTGPAVPDLKAVVEMLGFAAKVAQRSGAAGASERLAAARAEAQAMLPRTIAALVIGAVVMPLTMQDRKSVV